MSDEIDRPSPNRSRSDGRAAMLALLLLGGCALSTVLKSPESKPAPAQDLIDQLHRAKAADASGRPPAKEGAGEDDLPPRPLDGLRQVVAPAPTTGTARYVNRIVGFSAEFPIDAAAETDLIESVDEKLVSVTLTWKGAVYGVEYDTGPEVVKPEDAAKFLASLAAVVVKRGGDLVGSNATAVGEGGSRSPAHDFSFKRADGAVVRCRYAVISGKLCGVMTTTADVPTAVRFLNSFRPAK
jgi:hypothetical protein